MNGANHKMEGFSTYPFNISGMDRKRLHQLSKNFHVKETPWLETMFG
ncbi:hypothetical protein P615_07210 [Brevibacillus laterosporus PE36]|nr:hypothetical protein P615_07210 [Brevibacillus laterosporus PE36]